MPSKTFLNLPKEKKVKFIKKSLLEFSNHRLKDASINRIVKSCDIARGSFYQYFNDIFDLYYYIFEVSRERFDEAFSKSIEKNKDLRKAFIDYYNTIIEYSTKRSNIKYFENVFRDMTLISIKEDFAKNKKALIGTILSNIDKKKINNVGKDEFLYIIELLYIETINSVISVLVYKENKKISKNNYLKNINFITKDMYK